ncbi:hypothetical protein FRC0480_01020 [Corynebacterium diphtheriae]|nr:hypothetical protein FRC0480_01020 [Corynebacterium diphtheriae]
MCRAPRFCGLSPPPRPLAGRGPPHGNNSDMRPSSDLIAKLQSIAACCPDGPTAEEVPLSPQSLLDKLDGVARNIYKTTKTLREARNEALRQYDR